MSTVFYPCPPRGQANQQPNPLKINILHATAVWPSPCYPPCQVGLTHRGLDRADGRRSIRPGPTSVIEARLLEPANRRMATGQSRPLPPTGPAQTTHGLRPRFAGGGEHISIARSD